MSKHSCLKVIFWAIPSFGHFKDFIVSSKVFVLMTSALAYTKCQVIFCPRRTVFVGDYVIAVMRSLFVCCLFKTFKIFGTRLQNIMKLCWCCL